MLRHILSALLSIFSLCIYAQGPEMNKAYTIDAPFIGNNSHNISKDYFLENATSTEVQLTNVYWGTLRIGQWGDAGVIKNGVTNNTFSYELTGTELEAAKNGNIYLQCEPTSNSQLIIFNKDANYVEPTPGSSSDTEDGEKPEGGSNNSPTLGFAEYGVGSIFNQSENVYTLTGNAETMVEGATINIISDGTDINCHLKENLYNTWIRGQKTITLTAEQVQKLAANDYVIYVLAWNCTVSNITLSTLNNNTDEEEEEEDPTPYDKDRTKAFGYEFTNAQLKKYPQLTDVPTVYLNVYAPDSYDTGTYSNNDIKTGTPQTLAAKYQLAANSKITEKKYNWYYQTQIIVRDDNGKMKERNELTTVRARGNSTWRSSSKKPLRLKFPSKTRFLATSADDKTSTNAKSWTLLANDFDKSMLRNGLTHELVDYINKVDNANNLPFNPACQYVDLVVNGEYWGTYQISDQVQVGPGRVDVDADNGWFVEYTINNNGFVEEPFLKIGSSYVNIKNPEDPNVIDGDPNSTAHIDDNKATTNPIYDDLKTMLNNLHTGIGNIVDYSGNYASSDWMKYIDTRSLVDWFIAMDITGNWDGDIANDYLYKDVTDKKLKVGPLWDLDLGFGNYQGAKKHFYEQGGGIKYSIEAMLKDPYFVKKLYERWQQIYNDGALTTYLNNKVTALSGTLAQTQAENYKKWYLSSNGLGGKTYSTYQAAVDAVVAFNNTQIPWLQTEYKSLYDSMGCAELEDIADDDDDEIDDTPIASTEIEQKIADKQQLTNLATVYLTVPDALNEDGTRKDINSVVFKKNGVADYHKASIEVVDNGNDGTGRQIVLEHDDKLNIKVRGNETAKEGVTKLPYRLKFEKDDKDPITGEVLASHKYDLLGNGINGYKKRNWVLLANKYDETFMHNALAYTIGKAVGMDFCPGYKFVDLVINGEYRGNYQISDHCEVDKNRINVDADNGWYLEANGNSQWEEPFVNPTGLYISIKNPEPDANSAEETQLKNEVLSYFNNCTALFDIWDNQEELSEEKQAALTNPNTGWRKYWDEESLINYYIGVNVTGNHDGFMTVKMYRNPGEKVKFGPLWDFDTSYGNYDDGKTLSEDAQLGSPIFCNFIHKLVQYDPVFVKKIHDKLHEVIDAGLQKKLLDEVDKLEVMLSKSQATENPNQLSGAYASSVEGLRTYIKTHLAWLVETIDAKYKDMGGDDIVIPDTPEEGEEEVGPALNIEYTVPDMGFTGGYANYPIPASAFNNKATSALVTVSGAVYIKFVYRLNQWGYSPDALAEYPNNGNIPQTGTYLVEGEMLQRALRGELAVNCDGNSNVVVTVLNYGATEDTPDTDPFNEQGTRKQLTNLPTIYLDADNINGEWLQAAVEVFDKDNKLFQGETWKKEGVSKKGNINVSVQYQGSGADNSKNSYRLKFNDKINLLSATGLYKQWVLLANDDDPTMLNNALAKELGDAIGMPWTPSYQFVDLYVNDKYMGTYQLTDRVKAEEGRSLVSGGNKNNDWQLRFNDDAERQEDGTTDFVKTSDVNVIYRNPDPKDYTTDEQKATFNGILSAMETYFNDFFAETATNTFGNIPENVDKQQLINWYIAQEILGVYKGFSSIEAYRSVTEGAADNLLHFGPLWDSEKGFGNTGEAPAINMSDLNTTGSHNGLMIEYAAFDKMKSIFNYLWTQDWFKSGVKTKWDAIKTSLPTTLSATITDLKGTIADSQALNAKKWNSSLGSYTSYEAALAATNTYITNRFAYLEKKFTELAGAAHVHSYTAYIDNGDGTHSRKCSVDDAVEEGSELHTLKTNSDLKAHCAVCGYTSTDAIEGAQADENVYAIKEYKKNNTSYITATTSFTPKANTFYESATALPESADIDNVIWKRSDEDYVANSIVITDGTAYDFDTKIHSKKAVYSRTTGTSMWGTMCIPFKIAQTTEEYDIYQLDALTINKAQGTATLTFSPATKTSGELPLVYKRKENATSLTFNGVAQINDGETAAEDVGYVTVKKSKKITDLMNHSGEWTLYGNVKAKTTISVVDEKSDFYKKQVYYFSGDKFIHCTGTVNVAPFRSFYVSTQDLSGIQNVKSFGIGISDDEEVTGVDNANIEDVLAIFVEQGGVTINASKTMNVKVYGLNGANNSNVVLNAGETRHICLAPGIYVINNKKIIIR